MRSERTIRANARIPDETPKGVKSTRREVEPLAHAVGEKGMEQRRHTLLIVDDEPDVLESLRHQFHRSYRVLTSLAGKDAIQILENDDVELILSDQRMPGMSGDQLLRQARQLKPDAVRMLFTGYADIQAVISAVNEGHIFRYILKPWDTAELEAIIRQGVEQHDLLAERRRLVRELQAANVQLVQANEDLARAGQLKTAFIEVASHEFNTPITLVLGLTELLRMSGAARSEQEDEILRQIAASGRQLSRLVTSMLTLLRTDDFRRTLKTSPVNLVELIRKVVEQVHPFIQARRLQLRQRLADDLGLFEIDADKISAVLINLLTNAIKFTPDGGVIELVARQFSSQEAEIYVEDCGVGLDPEELKHLFQPFFTQLDPSRHSSGDFGFCKRGLGLGLTIAKQFVEMHGGRIVAASRDGGGTRITLHLPRRARSGGDQTDAVPPVDARLLIESDVRRPSPR
jgi:signal transduction histidine kinase